MRPEDGAASRLRTLVPPAAVGVSPCRQQGGARRPSRAFFVGLTTPSPVVAVVMMATMIALLAACCVIVTPDAIAGGMWRLLATSPNDSLNLEATARWLDLQRRPPRSPAVLVVGSSAMQEALLPAVLQHELHRRLGRAPDIRPLLMRGLTAWEMVAVADLLPPETRGVVVLGFGFGVLAPRSGPRPGWLLPVGGLERALRERLDASVAEPTGVYFLDRFRSLAPRVPHMLRQLVAPAPVRPRRGYRRLEELAPDAATAAILAAHRMSAAELEQELGRSAAVLEEVVIRLMGSGRLSVIMVEPPSNREAAREWLQPGLPAAYRRTFDAIVAATGAAEIPASRLARLEPADFLDVSHLDPAGGGPERFTKALACGVADLLQGTSGVAE